MTNEIEDKSRNTRMDMGGIRMTLKEKLNWVHWAIQEGLDGNRLELERALYLVEELREEYE